MPSLDGRKSLKLRSYQRLELKQVVFKTMGTIITLRVAHPEAEKILQAGYRKMLDYNERFSTFRDDSQLQQINLNAGKKAIQVDEDLFHLIDITRTASIQSKGKLNIAIGPLVKLWKIGFGATEIPNQVEIDQTLELIDPSLIELNHEKREVYLPKEGMEIDLGAVAKGFFADETKQFFIEQGVKSGFIDLGGNVLTIGENPKRPDKFWRVGIQDPEETRGKLVAAIKTKGKSTVTSGIYERVFHADDGEQYHHILDSQTGYPVENQLASVSILTPISLDAEVWTTNLFYHSPEESLALVNEADDVEALIIDRAGNFYLSKGMQEVTTFV